jgi:hypothetical protein
VLFVRKSPGRAGSTKVQIAERRAGRDVVVEHVGTARTDAELAVLMAQARRRLHEGQEVLDLDVGGLEDAGVPERPGLITSKRSALLWEVLTGAYARLGFDAIEDEAFAQLVLARIIEPTSKAASVRVLSEVGVEPASLRTMFRSLQRAQQRDYRGQIATACFNHAAINGDVSLVLYDVTTLYFEAGKEDDLRKVGYSKERRVDPQVVVGLLVDRRGFPLEIGCYEGHKAETLTIVPIVKAFAERHGIVDMVVVADAGMLSSANLRDLDEAGLRFIVGSRVTKAPKDLESHFRWHGDAFTDGQVIDTITPRDQRGNAVKTSDPMKRAEPVWDPTARTPRFVKTRNGASEVDEASLARARRLVGLEGYLTNIEAAIMPPAEVIGSYHDLWHVEQSFRMSKTDLRARPMFHHQRDAIEAHLTIVFAALAVARYLQDATGLSIKRIVQTLRPLQQITVRIAGHEHTAADPLTPTATAILDALGINAQ